MPAEWWRRGWPLAVHWFNCYDVALKLSKRDELGAMDFQELSKVNEYLKKLFGNAHIRVVSRPKKADSAEVYVGEEFIGVIFVDEHDDERSYNFQMSILETDLE